MVPRAASRPPPETYAPAAADEIEVAGSIDADTVWSAGTVRVVGDVTVEDGVTLTIVPGVRVEFQGYYRLSVAGTLLAVGTHDRRIVFTTGDPQSFTIDRRRSGCWNGIRFENTPATNAPSRLAYCIIEYSKALDARGGLHPYGGGAISVDDFSDLAIENCIIRNNVAEYGGAIFLYRNANARVVGNLISHNHALGNAAAIYCAYSYPVIANNTIVRNAIHNDGNPYIETCALLSFLAKPRLTSNIIRDNEPSITYMHSQLWSNKDYYTRYNNIQDYPHIGGNIDADPLFVDPDGPDGDPDTWHDNDYHLSAESPCIDAGDPAFDPELLPTDIDGQQRVWDGTGDGAARVDIGSDEFGSYRVGDLNCDGSIDGFDIEPFVLAVTDPEGYATAYPNCDRLLADCNGDGIVDGFDIQRFVELLTGG